MKRYHARFSAVNIILSLVISLAAISLLSCEKREPAAVSNTEKLQLVVSILPHSSIAEKIGGDLVDVLVLVGEGQSPHNYEPSPRQMAQLSKAAVWFLSGTDFEIGFLPKIKAQYPALKTVDGTEGVVFRSMEAHSHDDDDEHHDENDHDGEDAHDEHDAPGSKDRHTWLGRNNIKIFATHVANALTELAPQHAKSFAKNLEDFIQETDIVFEELKVTLKPLYGTKAFVYHPAFGYFLDEFGIEQFAVETGGKEPTAKNLNALIELAKLERPTALFVQAQFPVAAAQTVAAAANAQVIPLDPLAPNLLENIEQMGKELQAAIR